MELKENERLVHIFKYGKKEIPVYYNEEKIKDRLIELNTLLTIIKSKDTFFSSRDKKLLIGEEVILSSFIEGYESVLTPSFLVDGVIGKDFASCAVKAGYDAYLKMNDVFCNSLDILSTSNIVSVWRELVKYKRFFRKNIRLTGVKVGSRLSVSHLAPPAKHVKILLDDMYSSILKLKDDDVDPFLIAIVFHYLFTFIHPFLDGNGRFARLGESYYIMKEKGIDFFPIISDAILRNKKIYYKCFKSGQLFGKNHLDVLSIDITDFIDFNLYTIEQGLIEVFKFTDKNSIFETAYYFEIDNINNLFNHLGQFDRVALKQYIDDIDIYCSLLLNGKIMENEYSSKIHVGISSIKNLDRYYDLIEEKWRGVCKYE